MKTVEDVINKYIESIHTQNYEDFDKVWAKESECTLISITNVFNGRENIYKDFVVGAIGNKFSNIDLINDGLTINQINDTLAIAIFKYHTECILRENGEPHGIQGLETQVIVKENNEWKLLHVHYSK